jgi:hypothetical protein
MWMFQRFPSTTTAGWQASQSLWQADIDAAIRGHTDLQSNPHITRDKIEKAMWLRESYRAR